MEVYKLTLQQLQGGEMNQIVIVFTAFVEI